MLIKTEIMKAVFCVGQLSLVIIFARVRSILIENFPLQVYRFSTKRHEIKMIFRAKLSDKHKGDVPATFYGHQFTASTQMSV